MSLLNELGTVQRILRARGTGLMQLDPAGSIVELDDVACGVFGLERSELAGKELRSLLAEPAPKLDEALGGEGAGGFPIWCQLAGDRIVEIRVISAVHGPGGVALGIERASESASVLGSDLISLVAHEMRTPLTGIIGVTEMFEYNLLGALTDEQVQHVKLLRSCGDTLLRLINDLLDVTRIMRGKMELRPGTFFVDGLLLDGMAPLAPLFKGAALETKIEIAPNAPKAIVGDHDKLVQVLINLLGNAFKFTEKGSVTVRVTTGTGPSKALSERTTPTVERRRQDVLKRLEEVGGTGVVWLTFEIIDTGHGIAKRDLEQIFKPFVRVAGAASRRYKGTGLGLAFCKEVLELMGGHVWATSTPGRGSTFAFELPMGTIDVEDVLAGAPAPTVEPEIPSLAAGERGDILVIDDDSASLECIARMLGHEGHRVRVTEDPVAGVQLAYLLRPDLILMDYYMPRLDGHQALMRIRDYAALRETPVIAVTSLTVSGTREKLLEQGFTDLLPKPFSIRALHDIVNRYLQPRSRA